MLNECNILIISSLLDEAGVWGIAIAEKLGGYQFCKIFCRVGVRAYVMVFR